MEESKKKGCEGVENKASGGGGEWEEKKMLKGKG